MVWDIGPPVAHRRQVDVDAKAGEEFALLFLHSLAPGKPILGEAVPGGGEGLCAEGGVLADAVHGAPFLVYGNQQREPGGGLVGV